jgi:hypothetical protein
MTVPPLAGRVVAPQGLGRPYLVLDDVRNRSGVLVLLRAVGEDGRSLADVSAACDRDGTWVRVVDSWVVVAGQPTQVFPSAAPDELIVDLAAPGREVLSLIVPVPAGARLPIRLGDVVLAGVPVTAAGQVRRLNAAGTPVAGALVSCLTDTAVPDLHPLALRVPLRAPLAVGTPVVPASVTEEGDVLTIVAPAVSGSDTLAMSARTGLSSGHLLRLGEPDREQYAEVAELVPPGAGGGDVRLARPLLASVPEGSPARRAAVDAAGPPIGLASDARAADGVLRLVADLVATHVMAGGDTYAVGAVTDTGGYYRLPGVRALAAVAVTATAPGQAATAPPTVWSPDPRTAVNVVHLGVQP